MIRRFVCFDLDEAEPRLNALFAEGWRVAPGTLAVSSLTRLGTPELDAANRRRESEGRPIIWRDTQGRHYVSVVACVLECEG